MRTPNPTLAIERYRRHAPGYDRTTHRMEPVRRRGIDRLALGPGDVVLDVACGTGKSFALIEHAIGPRGRIVAADQSPEMLAIAHERVRAHGWRNVTLIEASMETARIPAHVDAITFNYTHDVLRSRQALDNIFAAARPGARVACAGMKYFPWWLAPLNLIVVAKAWPYMTTLDGLAAPWRALEPYLVRCAVEPMYCGMAYVASGTTR